MGNDSIEAVAVRILRETDKAYELQEHDDVARIAWFPKSQVSFKRRNIHTGHATAEIPLWLLREKGWDS